MPTPTGLDSALRRRELGAFLRTRRERLAPAEVGLPQGERRRTPGLRREEVAQLADVGISWYTWLEQGREINASAQVLDRLACALRLSDAEREHLFVVAHQRLPLPPPPENETVSSALQAVLDNQGVCPAYITGWRWDVLAWNRAACVVLRDFATIPADQRNSLWNMFLNPEQRRQIVDWEEVAQRMLAQFRTDAAQHPNDLALRQLIDLLSQESVEFGRWWPRHDIQGRRSGRKELEHPVAGRIALDHSVFRVNDAPHLRLVIYTPADAAASAKLHYLIAAAL